MNKVVLSFALVVALALPQLSLAQGGNRGAGMGNQNGGKRQMKMRMKNLSPEKKEKLKALREAHQAKPCAGDAACMEARKVERDAILNEQEPAN